MKYSSQAGISKNAQSKTIIMLRSVRSMLSERSEHTELKKIVR